MNRASPGLGEIGALLLSSFVSSDMWFYILYDQGSIYLIALTIHLININFLSYSAGSSLHKTLIHPPVFKAGVLVSSYILLSVSTYEN